MANTKKRRRRRGTAKVLKQMIGPVKDFQFENPNDPEDIIFFTVRKLSPGHLLQFDSSMLLKVYTSAISEETVPPEESTPEGTSEEQTRKEMNEIIENLAHCAEIASLAIVDESGQPYLSKEECHDYLLPNWVTEIAQYALGDAMPGGETDEVDRFPTPVDGDEKQEPENGDMAAL